MNADGSNQTRLTAEPGNDTSPKWSPDGRILFISDRDGRKEIYVMNGDGSNVTRLTTIGASQAAWSADGKRVAFVRPSLERIGALLPMEIYVADADGMNMKMLTTSPGSKFSPCWSPDGAAIAFNDEKLRAKDMANLFQVDMNGHSHRRLTAGPKMDERAAYSPDGSKLAFQSNREGNYEIYVMNLR
jgi:TolB protein